MYTPIVADLLVTVTVAYYNYNTNMYFKILIAVFGVEVILN